MAPGGWEKEKLGWLEGGWGTWRPFCAGVERISFCSVTNAELRGAHAAIKIVARVLSCLSQDNSS